MDMKKRYEEGRDQEKRIEGGRRTLSWEAQGRQTPAPTNQKTASQPHTTSSWHFSSYTLHYNKCQLILYVIRARIHIRELTRVLLVLYTHLFV
jgi:hypothetical protein